MAEVIKTETYETDIFSVMISGNTVILTYKAMDQSFFMDRNQWNNLLSIIERVE